MLLTPARLAALEAAAPFVPEPGSVNDLYDVRYTEDHSGMTYVVCSTTDVARAKQVYGTYAATRNVILELYDHTLGIVRASRRI